MHRRRYFVSKQRYTSDQRVTANFGAEAAGDVFPGAGHRVWKQRSVVLAGLLSVWGVGSFILRGESLQSGRAALNITEGRFWIRWEGAGSILAVRLAPYPL